MITPGPLIAAAHRRFLHRSFHESSGDIRMLRKNGKQAVWLTEDQWQELLQDFINARKPINRSIKWGFNLALPMFILSIMLYSWSGLLNLVDRVAPPTVNIILSLLVMLWWLIFVIVRYDVATRKIDDMIESRLATMPDAPVPPGRPVLFQTLEIVALFLVGPGLIIDVTGSIFPHLFDHTPLMGSKIGLFSGAGILLFALFVGNRLARRLDVRALS